MAKVYDSATGITTTYYYDLTGRLVKHTENGTGHSFTVAPTYDSKNLATYVYEETNGYGRNTWYTYDDDNRLKSTQKGWVKDAYAYDPYGRLYYKWLSYKSTLLMETGYTFVNGNDTTSNQVATLQMDAAGYDVTYSYTYDKNGNITSISDGTYTISYEYDSINQLVRENNQAGGFTHTWEYDNAGNISKRKEYAYTTEENLSNITPTDIVKYDYGNSQWGDLLTVYDGTAINYDNIGNPQSDGTWNYTWEHGRQLASMSKTGTTWNYTYGADGMRTQRTDGTTTYKYYYDGGQLLSMTVGDKELYFGYSNGSPMSVVYENDVTYYYVTNLQGDVVAILDGNGNQVVGYTYDAWGNLLSTTGTMAATLGADNPLRYRGYVYDRETGLYYLQSRYYNPQIGRFINADGLVSSGQGLLSNNMFAYCGNNPVNYIDPSGSCFIGYDGRWYHDNWEFIGGYERKPDPRTPPTSVSDDGLQFIADYETYHQEPYDDGYGNLTIGYGHVIKSGETFSYLTEEDAKVLLKKDLLYWENEVAKYSAKYAIIWDQNEFDAFVSLACNSGYSFQNVMDLIIDGTDPHKAFTKIVYAGGSKVLGLYRRRMDEADMYVSGIYKRTYREWQ